MIYDEKSKNLWKDFFKTCENISLLLQAKQKMDNEVEKLRTKGIELSDEEMAEYESICSKTEYTFQKHSKKMEWLENELNFKGEKKFLDYFLN